jgi:hypothetical protein
MKTKSPEQIERALWAACMGNLGMANHWLIQAQSSIRSGESESGFVAASHIANRRKASAAYRLAVLQNENHVAPA